MAHTFSYLKILALHLVIKVNNNRITRTLIIRLLSETEKKYDNDLKSFLPLLVFFPGIFSQDQVRVQLRPYFSSH